MTTQLDRIEQKLDRLLSLVGSAPPPASSEDEFMTVLATQGAEAAHKWQKDQMKRRRKSA
jgi:hypothetical protein